MQGLGLGLRFKYLDDLLQAESLPINWLELLADHFHDLNAPIVKKVECLLERFPCALHSVNLSIASTDKLNETYLTFLENLVERFNPAWVSDHLCFSHVGQVYLHDLLPIPFTYTLLDHVAFKVDQVQKRLKRPFLIENISSYLRLKGSEMSEAEFIEKLTKKTGCGILLDVNNVVVTCHNHGESIQAFCEAIPFQSVKQLHMAGAVEQGQLLIDTHSQPMAEDVLALYSTIIAEQGEIPTCLEWDNDLPEFALVLQELKKLQSGS